MRSLYAGLKIKCQSNDMEKTPDEEKKAIYLYDLSQEWRMACEQRTLESYARIHGRSLYSF